MGEINYVRAEAKSLEEDLIGIIDGNNRTFTISTPAQNVFGGEGHKIEVYHNNGKLDQVSGVPLGLVFIIVDTALPVGYDTIELGFAPISLIGSKLTARYYPATA